MLGHEVEVRARRLLQEPFAGDAVLDRRSHWRIAHGEVDVDDAPAPRECLRQAAEERGTVWDVVVGVHDEREVATARREHRVVSAREHRRDVSDSRPSQALAQHVEDCRLRIHRVHQAGRAYHASKAEGEEAGPGADVGDHLTAPERERAHDGVGLLPSRTPRVRLAPDEGSEIRGVAVAATPHVPVPWTVAAMRALLVLVVWQRSLGSGHCVGTMGA